MNEQLREKERTLRRILSDAGSCLIAFSGGVDSAYLAVTAADELGDRALAVTAESPSYSSYQKGIALDVVRQFGILHEFIPSAEIDDPDYRKNPVNRCYFCKHELYSLLAAMAADRGFNAVLDGNNTDDTGDHRPGREAGRELEVRSPLIEAGLGKDDIRELSRLRGLPTWDLPASACLASRIPYGSPVTVEKLRMIDDGESVLRSMGFRQSRVRHHGDIARIEIAPDEMERALNVDTFGALSDAFRAIGFQYTAVDVTGYRTGALNETLHKIEAPGKA